jgi:tungstate transport system ATP-binding protein
MMLELTASGIGKTYNGGEVLKDCYFSFKSQELYVLTGTNGCGKSTFLRICALIELPDKGDVAYFSNGKTLTADLDLRRRITLVLPKVGVFNTTVLKNVAYGLRIRGMGRKQIEERVKEILDFVHLGHKGNQNALTLSSGETQRLGIARALVIEPEVIFLDEPTASVDQKNVEIIESLIMKMRRDRDATVVITTHDREQAERLRGSLLTMSDGKIYS